MRARNSGTLQHLKALSEIPQRSRKQTAEQPNSCDEQTKEPAAQEMLNAQKARLLQPGLLCLTVHQHVWSNELIYPRIPKNTIPVVAYQLLTSARPLDLPLAFCTKVAGPGCTKRGEVEC